MPDPKIIYGTITQTIHPNAEYLMMRAGIQNGEYSSADFLREINSVSLDHIKKEECQRDIEIQRDFLNSWGDMVDTITIKDFEPNKAKLEKFVSTAFREMKEELEE